MDFTDRVAIVTGAGGGLGRTHALALAARGCKPDAHKRRSRIAVAELSAFAQRMQIAEAERSPSWELVL